MKKLILAATLVCTGVAAQAQERTVRGVLGLGLTGGGDTLATVVYTDGSTDNIKSGGLVHVFGGAEFRLGPQVTMQATVGYHVDETNGNSDGSLRFSRYPIELLGHYHVAPQFKLGGGARFVNNAKIDSSGVLSGARIDFDNTVGGVIEGEWMVTPFIGLKLRYVSERYKSGAVSVDANHGGFYFSWYL
ncbi:MAG TPA: outer membrane beta-barrel protein [Burkholderiaceae bacterium]|nr:outer membrane beta-barrel protein [Burkholderiaceae bacterium]